MNYQCIKMYDIADGLGIRTSLYVSGCRRHCKGCHNSQAWEFESGQPFTWQEEASILDSLGFKYCRGLSILGGEPFEPENRVELLHLTTMCKTLYPYKDIWIWSGFTAEELMNEPECRRLLHNVDVLVDGDYREECRDLALDFRGSSNQRILYTKDLFSQY